MTEDETAPSDVSKRLAHFLVDARPEDMPAKVQHEAKRSLLNFFGTAIGGSRDSAAEHMHAVLAPFAGPAAATVIGRAQRSDPLTAAFFNAAAGNIFDFDDSHVPTVIHPTAPIAPAALVLAETQPISGRQLLHAFVLGLDVTCRIGNAVSPAHYRKGWHITATCGVFGAAAAAGKLLGLDTQQMTWALGNASAQSSGLVETLGFMAKSIGVGNAARNGLLSALLARQGVTGPDKPLEGPRGFAHVMGEAPHLDAITVGLGERWEILANTYKPYPCGVVLNPVIDGCLELRDRHHIAPETIKRMTVTAHPLMAERTDRPIVTTGREAQVSCQHSVAVTMLQGAAGLAQFSDAAANDSAVVDLRSRVVVARDNAMPVGAASITVERADRTNSIRITHARGSLERPLSDNEIETKVRELARHGWPGADVSALIDAVWSLDRTDDGGKIMRLAAPAS